MKVKTLFLENFRNIKSQQLTPSDELTVICGKNGQGKTNLLESIWLLTGAKSFRASKDIELIKKGEEFSVITAGCVNFEKESNIRLTISQNEKKGRYAKINGVDYGRATSIAGTFTAVVFAPSHLSLIKGSPEGRRRFLDAAICQLYPSYIFTLRKYNRLLTQKNALLKQRDIDKEILSAFNDGLAAEGEKIMMERNNYLSLMFPFAKQVYDDISDKKEELFIKYNPCCKEGEQRKNFEQTAQKDIKAGFSTFGVHREDFDILLNESDAKIYASQGQQRSCVLALKLAEAAAGEQIRGEHPVMLLDDVLSELDYSRQEYLLTKIKNKQTIVTACDRKAFLKADGKIYEVENGQIKGE